MLRTLLLLAVMLVAGGSLAARPEIKTLEQYGKQIDYSCKQASDCVIKNVANCCGAFPECVNKEAYTDPELVQRLCKEIGGFSVCGFADISRCECQNER